MDLVSQNLLLTSGGKKDSTFVDDVFSTFLYTGNGGSQTINNGIDLDGEGGLVWFKRRDDGDHHLLTDTVRGTNKQIYSNLSNSQASLTNIITSFNSNGFALGNGDANQGGGNRTFTAWTFRKAPGFFDVVTYTGTGVTRTVPHNLESIPGMILVKRIDSSHNWGVYHRGLNNGVNPERYRQRLNVNGSEDGNNSNGESYWANTAPTSTHFTVSGPVGGNNNTNVSGASYVAYLFAGGESTAATAKSVKFTKSNSSYLSIADNDDFDLGTGDFTVECWVRVGNVSATSAAIFMIGNEANTSSLGITLDNSQAAAAYVDQGAQGMIFPDGTLAKGQWRHLALTKSSNVVRMFVDGTSSGSSYTQTNSIGGGSNGYLTIGASDENGTKRAFFDGEISNFRIIKGTALYTSSFRRPPYEPLTNITNTKLLCCNNSSVTGSTVTPGTITSSGNPTASTNSPFDDPEGFKFGEGGDQNIIKTGNYIGASSDVHVYTGGESQWIMVKNTSRSETDWYIIDVMRGAPTPPTNCNFLLANTSGAENDMSALIVPTTQGFIARTGAGYAVNYNGDRYVYISIRRPDGYVGKPAEAGTDAFAMDTGNASSTIPNFDSGFPVGFAIMKTPASSGDWYTGARLLGERYVRTNNKAADADWGGGFDWDSNVGWLKSSATSAWQSWMWKRHAGFDVVTYKGNSVQGHDIPHNLGKVPEMMWVKNRTRTTGGGSDWYVYVGGITHLSVYGSDPDNYGNNPSVLELNEPEQANFSMSGVWDHTHPTSTHFRVGDTFATNENGQDMIAFLFASVEGVSKVGSYSGSSYDVTITTGFTPRFVLVKKVNAGAHWHLFDSLRSMGASGNDGRLILNNNTAQDSSKDYVNTTATGFVMKAGADGDTNGSGGKYIYYAHA